jgi:TPR repeat protein
MAMDLLASFYEQGRGVAKDENQARVWYSKAADAGNADAKKWIAEHGGN